MKERQTYPSRRHLNYLDTNPGITRHHSERPRVIKEPLDKMAILSVGLSLAYCNGKEVVKKIKMHDSENGIKYIPLIIKPITPLFTTKNRGCLGGGTSPEALRRAKQKARLTTNHNHNGNK